jgi:glyoxylase-like metal-dependent hydrolase (beta-lactamase superfamily II)
MNIAKFTFNPFQENTYLLFDETNECVIVDPGCYSKEEKKELFDFISTNNLKPVRLLLTHCHIDHILGNSSVFEKYNLTPECHTLEAPVLASVKNYAHVYGINYELSPEPNLTLDEGKTIIFGNTTLTMIHVPGHSPGSICFYDEKLKILIGGDVLFKMSIGRTDLPGGDTDTLLNAIHEKIFVLPDDVTVYPGHGPETTVGFERRSNPFLNN